MLKFATYRVRYFVRITYYHLDFSLGDAIFDLNVNFFSFMAFAWLSRNLSCLIYFENCILYGVY